MNHRELLPRDRPVALAVIGCVMAVAAVLSPRIAEAQVPPDKASVKAYRGLFAAAARGDDVLTRRLLAKGADPNATDGFGRTPAHVAAHFKRHRVLRSLLRGGADPNTLENDRYDIITIAAVANDPETITTALSYGAKPTNITSRYDGTALIAAAHLGNVEAVRVLVGAGAPLDHVNNLRWTALLEAIILGDGGPRHLSVVTTLVRAGADVNIADGSGTTPLAHALARNYRAMVAVLQRAGAH